MQEMWKPEAKAKTQSQKVRKVKPANKQDLITTLVKYVPMAIEDYFHMTRPMNCAMAAFGTFIGYSIATRLIQTQLGIIVAMATAFLICAGGMAINDYYDRQTDSKLHPNKPIPAGRVSPKQAMTYSAILFLTGNLLAYHYLPTTAFAIAFVFTILLIAYSRFLSKAKYIGNIVVASGTAFTLIFGASLVGNYQVIAFLAASALFANIARELIKDLEDLEADKGFKKTLPMILDKKATDAVIFACYLAAIITVYVPLVLLSFGKMLFVIIVSIANFAFLYSFKQALKKNYARAQIVSKAAMFIALLGFLLGAA